MSTPTPAVPETKDQKIMCMCGSEILAKNTSAHNKTKKHILASGGVVPEKKPKAEPPVLTKPATSSNPKDAEEDEGQELEFEDEVLDRLEHLEESLEHLTQLIMDGFNTLMGEPDLATIDENKATLKPERGSLKYP